MKRFCSGLKSYQQLKLVSERGPAKTWPKLSMAADEGSDVRCLVNACVRKFKLNMDYTPDGSHCVTNDVWNSGAKVGPKSFFYMILLRILVKFFENFKFF